MIRVFLIKDVLSDVNTSFAVMGGGMGDWRFLARRVMPQIRERQVHNIFANNKIRMFRTSLY